MTLTQLVSDSYLAYRGKLSSVPAAGAEKYNRIVNIANRKQREWAQDTNIDWPSRYEIRTLGTLSTGTQAYDLDDDILRPSDMVNLVTTAGSKRYVGIVKPQQQTRYTQGAYVTGFNPKQLTFIQTIDSSLAGTIIKLPCFTMPTDMVNANDLVAVDDPQWLVYAVAAELSRNDYAKEEQYPNLIGQANDLYAKMINDAQTSSFGQPNGVVNAMPQNAGLDYNSYSGYGII